MPISRYCKGSPEFHSKDFRNPKIISFITGSDGVKYSSEVDEVFDTSQFGSFYDWSLKCMIDSGINPESFSSPSVSLNRLEASELLSNSSQTYPTPDPTLTPNPSE